MTTELIAEIDQIIEILESEIPANINSPKNRRLENGLRKELGKYFKSLADAFPYDRLNELYYRHIKESLASDTTGFLDPLLATLRASLVYRLNGHLAGIYIAGSAQMITWGKTKGGKPIAYEGPPVGEAITWAEKHCAKLVTQVDELTKKLIANTVSDGIQNKRGIDGLARDIKSLFSDMSSSRARMIAQTETANALGESFLQRGKAMGVEGKQWVTAGGDVCEICLGNESDGIIPFSDKFSNGDMTPPAHPRCRCACAPANLPEEK